jgi:hypothetical protein
LLNNFQMDFLNFDRSASSGILIVSGAVIRSCHPCRYFISWPTKSELRRAYYGRNKARIFNGAIDSANLKKFTLNQLHLLAK